MARIPSRDGSFTPSGLIVALSLTAFAILLPSLVGASDIRLATEILALALFAASLNLLVGYTGLISLGHAAYFGVGAYTAALLSLKLGVVFPLAFLAAPFAAAIVAAIIGAFCVRLAHAYFVMLTLAFGQLVYSVFFKWREMTGGDDGLLGIYPSSALRDSSAYYYFTLGSVLVCLAGLYLIAQSPFGYSLRAIRDNPERAQSSGIDVYLHRLLAFVLAGSFAGVGGALWAFYQHSVFPDSAYWLLSAEGLVMVALGGGSTFFGPLIGASIYRYLEQTIPNYTEFWPFALGILIIGIAILAPRGITRLPLAHWWSRVEAVGGATLESGARAAHRITGGRVPSPDPSPERHDDLASGTAQPPAANGNAGQTDER